MVLYDSLTMFTLRSLLNNVPVTSRQAGGRYIWGYVLEGC